MSDEAMFRKMDEDERIYAPQQLPHDDQAHLEAADRIPLIAAGDIGATAGGVPVQSPPGGVVLPGNPIVETHAEMPHGGVGGDLDERDEDR